MIELTYRKIDANEFTILVKLFQDYNKVFALNLSEFESASLLMNLTNMPDFMPIGFYLNEELVGFMLMYGLNPEVYYVHSLYLKPELRGHNNLNELLQKIEKEVIVGYKKIEADASSLYGKGKLEDLGFKPVSVKYQKEVNNG